MPVPNPINKVKVMLGYPERGEVSAEIVRWVDKTPHFHTDFVRSYRPTPASLKRLLDTSSKHFDDYGDANITFTHKDGAK